MARAYLLLGIAYGMKSTEGMLVKKSLFKDTVHILQGVLCMQCNISIVTVNTNKLKPEMESFISYIKSDWMPANCANATQP